MTKAGSKVPSAPVAHLAAAEATPPTLPAPPGSDLPRAVIERLVERGLSAPWANVLVDMDIGWIEGKAGTMSIDGIADEVFDAEVPSDSEPYRERVATLLDHYGLQSTRSDDLVRRNMPLVDKARLGRLPPWCTAAQLLMRAKEMAELTRQGARVQERDVALSPAQSLGLSQQAGALLEQAVRLGLLGQSVDEVIRNLVHQGLLGLVRDGLLRPAKQSADWPARA